jgi:hypothetical protein
VKLTKVDIRSWYSQALAEIQAERDAERAVIEAAEEQMLLQRIAAGPPDRRIEASTWERWCRKGAFTCPAGLACGDDEGCQIGFRCEAMAEIGKFGNGAPIPKAERVRCGAKTRKGDPCVIAVVPGKRRCKLHGGLSTGPRTEEGKLRIGAAQRHRWDLHRAKKAMQHSPEPAASEPARVRRRRRPRGQLSGMAL